MELRFGDLRIRAHPLALLLPLLGMALGLRTEVPVLLLSLAVHEAGHLLAARLVRVRVSALSVTPFGCGLRLDNLFALSPGQQLAVASGGPAASLLLLLVDGAMAHWGLLSPALALRALRINLTLLLFNLLPALPLDGGRMLYALLSTKLDRKSAVRPAAALGYVAALSLIVGTAWLWIRVHRLNLTLPACALFMLKGLAEDRRALVEALPVSMLNALSAAESPIPLRLYAVSEDYPALDALRQASPDAAALFAVYRGTALTAFTDERALLELALDDPGARVGQAHKKMLRIA